MRLLLLVALVLASGVACGGEESSSSSPGGQEIEVRLSEFEIDPARITIDEPGTYTFHAINDGSTVHALEVEGHGVEEETEEIQPGATADLTVELAEAGEYVTYCPVDGHRAQGMKGAVVVGGTAAGGGGTTEDDGGGGEDGDDDEGSNGSYG